MDQLSALVAGEARRAFTDEQLRADPALVAAGWERRFLTDKRRAPEMLELYRYMGFEARAEPIAAGAYGEQCGDCQLLRFQFCMIYTKPRTGEGEAS